MSNLIFVARIVVQDLAHAQMMFDHLPADFVCVNVKNLSGTFVVTILRRSEIGGQISKQLTPGMDLMQICNVARKKAGRLVTK